MLVVLKIIGLSIIFVSTGGAVFTDWGRKNRTLLFLAGIVAVIGSTYLIRDIYNDLKIDIKTELRLQVNPQPPISSVQELAPVIDNLSERTGEQSNDTSSRSSSQPSKPTTCFTYDGQVVCD